MISRMSWKNRVTCTLTDSLSTTPVIDTREAAGIWIEIVGTPTNLTFYGSTDPEGTFVPLHNLSDNSAYGAKTVTQGKGYSGPDGLFPARAIKIVAGSTLQEIKYSLKV